MTKLIVSNKSELKAQGYRTNGNCKPIMCIDTGEVYASMTDAAEKLGTHVTNVSCAVLGKTKTCKGKRFCFVSRATEHLAEITESIRIREEKAKAYEEFMCQQEIVRQAEEKVAKRKAAYEKLVQESEQAKRLMYDAESELIALQRNAG